MTRNFDFNRAWNQVVHETLHDNTHEEMMRYLHHVQQQAENSNWLTRTRTVINHNRGEDIVA